MKQSDTLKEMVKNVLPKMKSGVLLILGSVLLIALLIINSFLKNPTVLEPEQSVFSSNQYISELESKLKKLLEKVDEVGECEVMITLESSSEYIYGTDEKISADTSFSDGKTQESEDIQKSYKTISESNIEKPLIIKELMPKIKGVAVICKGGGSARVKMAVMEIISTVLGITSDKIAIGAIK